jgi:Ethanolamine utilization protein EutJ (predicted chaperonin)
MRGRAIRESAQGATVLRVFLIEEPVTAAIGASLLISEAMVVDTGSGLMMMGSHLFIRGDLVWGAEDALTNQSAISEPKLRLT